MGTFLDRFRQATGSDYVVLNFRPPGRPHVEAVTLISGALQADMEKVVRDRLPPGEPPIAETLIEGRPYSLEELFGEMTIPEPDPHRRFLAEAGITSLRQMRVQERTGVRAWLDMVRAGGEDFGEREVQLMASLAPFLRTAVRHHVASERHGFEAAMMSQAIRRSRPSRVGCWGYSAIGASSIGRNQVLSGEPFAARTMKFALEP